LKYKDVIDWFEGFSGVLSHFRDRMKLKKIAAFASSYLESHVSPVGDAEGCDLLI
jgi:hypothetical protein